MRVPPVIGDKWQVWAEEMRRYLGRAMSQLVSKDAGANASEDGVLLWDRANGYPVVSSGGAFDRIVIGAEFDAAPRILRVPIHANAVANITLTNQANAEDFLGSGTRFITMVDLSGFTQYRLMSRVIGGSASANNPRLYARYKTGAFSATFSDYLEIGTSAEVVSIASAGHVSTPWTPLVSGAIANAIFVAVLQNGGDGVADPAIGNVHMEFK